ncbi:Glycosyl hydrolases family 2, sugar binding domain [Pirellulimonas nuda]|uniref:Glycosyl hydrolases family 2, sugar binding domain n=1 Tax=Pirellulimonas nuda TaxID=2528009 RepID=A0A518DBS3_9BACT|nr:glycosyl hydrolase [Pirellulimonas nuda]QDU88910.1 Glycosyl hydrolases family 2, sugar binding domain [Pirellulimonas nuda]
MKTLMVVSLVCAAVSHLFAADSLRDRFQSPPKCAKPHTWWHWMNGYVSAEGITKDLEAMARAGVGGLQAFQIERGMDPGPVKYLSTEWRELMTHAIKEADRLGLEVCFHNCAGWSSSGGPWITPEHAMQNVVWTQQRVLGPKNVDVKLQRPKNLRDDYFQDIAVLAFPTPESERSGEIGFRVANWKAKAGYERDNQLTADTRQVESGDLIELASIVDLTQEMDANGWLKWKVPQGHWTIVRFGHAVCGLRNRPAPQEARGNECDKMSKAAAAWHWKHTVQKVIVDAGPLTGKAFNNVLIDSYETGQQNWTSGFETEFQRRMGYDAIKYLPAVTGRVINDLEHTERFLWDFRRTIADMWTENYFGHFAEMCHQNGLLLSCEPYGLPGNMDDFAVADVVDIPMGEWWARTTGGPFKSSSKLAASAAHTNGRRFVGAEAFTAGRMTAAFVNHPYALKAQGDYFFCQGANRIIFHTFVHQPWGDDVKPGMTMGPWGFQNNRNNTWYEQGKAWNEYLARSQYLLQEGAFQADICYYPGESAPQTTKAREDMNPTLPVGYDYDTISRNSLLKLSVDEGRLVLPGLMEYRLLVMPDGPVRPEVLKKVQQLLSDGAHVVWKKPQGTPGLQDYPNADRMLAKTADQVWRDCDGTKVKEIAYNEGRLYWPRSLAEILSSMGVQPDVSFFSAQATAPALVSSSGYEWIHRRIGSADVYLISNQQEVARQVEVVFRIKGRVPELWNAQTGEVSRAPLYQTTDHSTTRVKLFMEPAESVFVVFNEKAEAPSMVDVFHNGKTLFNNSPQTSPVLAIHRAVYGDLNGDSSRQVNVTDTLANRVSSNSLRLAADNRLAGRDPAIRTKKQLRVDYSLGGIQSTIVVDENEMLDLGSRLETVAATPAPAKLSMAKNGSVLTAMEAGNYELFYSDGTRKSVKIPSIPDPIDLSADWTLHCPRGWGPTQMNLAQLVSWPKHGDPDLAFFSGTAVYKKQFDVPTDRRSEGYAVSLDLGDVQVFAEVFLNGKNLGILWKPPYQLDATGLLKGKGNQLEVRVTNLWVNRLIGDEQYPATDRYEAGGKAGENLIEKIPDWLENGSPRPVTERKSFTTCRFYEQDSPLIDSGLIGPVRLHFGIFKPILHDY